MIEVILREDVQSLGKAGTLVRVKPGYARNYLLPKGLAYEATEGNRKRIAGEARARDTRLAGEKQDAEAAGATLAGVVVTVPAKAGDGNRLFGSVTAQDIAAALAAQGHPVDRRKIDLEHPIKNLGEHAVPIRLHAEVQIDVRVIVVAE